MKKVFTKRLFNSFSPKALMPLMMVLLCVLGTTNAWAHDTHYGKIIATTKGNGSVYISTSNTTKTGGTESAATADASVNTTWNCGGSSGSDSKTVYIWATGNAGYYLSAWSGTGSGTNNPVTATLTASSKNSSSPTSATYTATFAQIPVAAGSAANYAPTELNPYSGKNITFATAKGARLTDFNTPQVGANTGNGAGTFAVNWGAASVDANGLVTIPYSFSATKYGKNTAVITLTTKAGQSNTVTVTANYPDALFSGAATETMYSDDKETKINAATVSVQYANVTADFNMATFTNIVGGGTWTVTGQNYADGVLTVDYTFFSNGALGTHTADLVFSAKDGSSETLTCTAIVEKQFDADVEVTNAGGTSLTGGLGTDLMSGLALANANAGSTITLMRSIDLGTLAAAPTITKSATLDLNGKVLSGTVNATIPYLLYINGSGVTVTIKDSKEGGTITATGARNESLFAVYVNNGNLIQQSGKIAIENTGIYNSSTYKSLAAYGVYLKKGSGRSFVMNGGTVESVSGRNAFGVRAENSAGPATITINGGEITATAPCTSYGIYSSGLVTVHGGTIKGVTDDINGVAGTTTAYGIYMYAGSSADNSSCYHGTLNMDGGTVKANSKTKTAAAVYIYGNVTATATAGAGADGTNSNKASAQAFITGGTIEAYAGTTDAYGVQVLGNTNSNNLTQTYPTYISNTTITASATGTAYGVYVWADAADKHGGCRQGEVVLDNNNVEATTRTGTIAYGVYVFAKQITITSTAAGYFPGEYATAGKCMINSGTYRGIAKTETGAGVATADRVVTTGANKIEAYPQLAIVDGTFYGEAQTQKGRAIISGGQTAINGGTFTATAPTNAIALYVSQGITAVKDGTYNATSTTTTTAYGAYQNAGKSLIYGGTYAGTATTTTAAGIKFNAGDGEITGGDFLGQTAYEPASDGNVDAYGLWVIAAASMINASGATFRANLTGASHNRRAFAVSNAGLLTLNGCTLTANSNYQYTYGVYTTNDATVRDCNITLTSTKAYDYGLHINAAGKTLTAINNTVSVTTGTTYGYGGYAQNGTLNLEGGSISVQGSQTGASAEADCVLRGVEIASGKAANITGTTITVRSTNSTYSKTAYGVLNAGTATLTDAKVTVSGIKTGAYGVYNNTNGKTLIESGKYSASASSTSIDVYDKVGNQALNIESGFFVHDNNLKSCIKGTALVFTLESTRDEYKEGYRYEVADQSQAPSVCKIGTTKYKTLEEALQYANANAGGGTIIMTSDYTLPTGHYTIPAKWTLLIPYSDSQNAATTTKPTSSKSGEADAVRFRKLTLSAGTELVVWGALEPSAKMSSNQWGRIDGGYGQIQMEEGSKITVESGATLAAWGYILGKGEVEIKKGGISRELFQLGDWKGGGVTSKLLNNGNKVFPVSHYFYQNIAVPVTYRAGAQAYGHTGVVAQSTEGRCDNALLVGTSGSLLLMDANDVSADTWVRKTYIAGKDSLEWFINSGAKLGSINLDVSGYSMNSTNYVLPLCPNMYFVFNKGEMDVTQSTVLLPGVRFIINKEGALNIPSGVTLYAYDADDYWSYTASNVTYSNREDITTGSWGFKFKYHPVASTRGTGKADLRDAEIFVHGKLTVNGTLQTTAAGANIHSTNADAGKIVFTKSAAADGSVSQCYAGWNPSTLQYKVNYISHPTTSAQLKNGDDSYVATKGLTVSGTNIHYIYKNNQWNKVEESGCFSVETDGSGNKTYYAYPSDFVAVAENTNGDHAYHNIEGDGTRYFVWDEDCMWWEATPATDGSANYLCVDTRNELNNGKYYTYNSTKGCWEVKYVTAVWKNYDNSTLATYTSVPYNTRPRYLSATPKRNPDATYATYYHDGWQINGEGTVYADDELPIATEDNTVYVAHFTGVKAIYTVAFKNADGKVLYSAQYEYGDMPEYDGPAPTKNPTAAKEYEFTGWNPALAAVTGANEYTAQYREVTRKYPITFLDNKGGILEEKMVEYGTTPSYTGLTPYMERDKYYSYTFEGWNKELVAVTGATTYTATFSYTERKYQITFANIDGLGAVHKQDYAADATPVFDGGTPYRESTAEYNYEFLYWKNAAGTTFLPGDALPTVDADVTYTAYFNETVRKFTITWLDENGGLIERTLVAGGELPTHADPTKSPTAEFSYVFTGWTPTIVTATEDATYQAIFTPQVRSYTITWKNEDGTTLETDNNVAYGATPSYDGTEPTKASTAEYDYTFDTWTPNVESVTGDATYTATYNQILRTYTLAWDLNGGVAGTGTITPAGSVANSTVLQYSVNPTKTGYTFAGWAPAMTSGVTTMPAANTTYVAQWTVNQFTITFNSNGGSAVASITQDYNTSVTAPADPTRTGYTFDGWNEPVPSTMPAENKTLTASWTINQYTITFNSNGGSAVASITQDYNTSVTAPADPTREGYTFAGWSEAVPSTMPAENKTLTASWTVNQYTITFNSNGGSAVASITQDYMSSITAPADPTKDGYRFLGWEPAVPSTMPINGVTCEAQWEELPSIARVNAIEYKSWESALAAANATSDATLTLLANVTGLTTVQTISKSMTLDLNGYTLSAQNNTVDRVLSINASGKTVTITDNSIGQTGVISNTYTQNAKTYAVYSIAGNMVLNGGTISVTNNNTSSSARAIGIMQESQTLTINGGTKRSRGKNYAYGIYTKATLKMFGGTIDAVATLAKATGVFLNTSAANITTQNAEIHVVGGSANTSVADDVRAIWAYNSGQSITIKEGTTIHVEALGSYSKNASVITFRETGSTANISGGKFMMIGTTAALYDGTPTLQITGGYYSNNEKLALHATAPYHVFDDTSIPGYYYTVAEGYNVVFQNEDETELQSSVYRVGETPAYTGETPIKSADAQYTYAFSTWSPAIEAVSTADQVYTAQFDQTPKSYTLTWNLNGGEIKDAGTAAGSVAYNTSLTAPVVEKTGYTFNGWDPAVPATMPAANATYTAQWTANQYTISWDANGGVLSGDYTNGSVDYGTLIVKPTATKDGCEFAGWTPDVPAMVTGDFSFTAKWRVNNIIITEDETISTPTEVSSLTIKAGAELTASATITAQNITIEATGELNTSAAVTVVQNLVFQTNESDDVATAVINGDLEVRGEAYLEMKITSARWHTVVLPSNVNTENVLVDGVSNKFRQSNGWLMRAFDAAEYACVGAATNNKGGQNGWYNVTSTTDPTTATTMQANVGYLVGLKHNDSEVHTLSFPITVGAQNTDLTVSTTAATGSQPEIYHGWNFVGVPYVSHYETEEFNSGAIEMVTYPVEGGGSFKQAWLGDVTLKPFSAYFFQVSSNLDMAYEKEQRVSVLQADAPASVAARVRAEEVSTTGSTRLGLILTNSHNETDKTWFNLNDNFTTNYEIGKDLSKMFGSSYKNYTEPVLYTCTSLGRMAFTAIPYATAEQMTQVGFYAAENGTYTFSLNTKGEMEDVQAVMLYDAETGTTTNLLWYDYEFYSTRQVQNEERFSLYIMRAPKTPTDINNTGTSNDSKHIQKVIQENKLYILIDNTMFDATGKRVH